MVNIVSPSRISHVPAWWTSFGSWSSHLGIGGLLVFVGVYVAATMCLVPSWLLKYGAGFAFGLVKGSLVALVGATAGAILSFFIARHWGREAVRRRLAGKEVFQMVEDAVDRKGAKIVFLMRLCPVLPGGALNYLFGLTAVRFRSFLHASWLAMAPSIFLYAYVGYASRTELGAAFRHGWGVARFGLWGVGLVAAALVVAEVLRPLRRERATRALALAAASGPETDD